MKTALTMHEDVWQTRIDGKYWEWLLALELWAHLTPHGEALVTSDDVMGPLIRAIEWPIFPEDWNNPDHDETMCPLVVRLESERQGDNDAENQNRV